LMMIECVGKLEMVYYLNSLSQGYSLAHL
jgi:hypothetical protein